MRFPSERVEAAVTFDEFFEEEHERLYKALYFVTGNRHDAEELMQDAFLRLWERWDRIDHIHDLTGYLFRVALNGFRTRRHRALTAIRNRLPLRRPAICSSMPRFGPRQRAALLLVDLLGCPSEQAARVLCVRPSTVRALATQGRRAIRATERDRDA